MEIVYIDNHIVICIKPAGIDSQKKLPELLSNKIAGEIYTVHRLDINVGGIMVYARDKKTAAHLSRCIQEGTMIKEYLALVHGQPPVQSIWEDLLWKDSKKNKVYVVKRERKGVRKAKLEFKTLHSGNQSLVHIRLYTGRSHQIRVQFASRGFPLVGDHKYGSRDKLTSPQLYSYRLTFPYQGKIMTFEKRPEWAGDNYERESNI